ncbi:MAG: hypothetical protein ACYSQY_00380 [Planctomycetota bacterium]
MDMNGKQDKGRIVTQTDNLRVARMLGQRVRLVHGERRARGSLIATAVTDAVRWMMPA